MSATAARRPPAPSTATMASAAASSAAASKAVPSVPQTSAAPRTAAGNSKVAAATAAPKPQESSGNSAAAAGSSRPPKGKTAPGNLAAAKPSGPSRASPISGPSRPLAAAKSSTPMVASSAGASRPLATASPSAGKPAALISQGSSKPRNSLTTNDLINSKSAAAPASGIQSRPSSHAGPSTPVQQNKNKGPSSGPLTKQAPQPPQPRSPLQRAPVSTSITEKKRNENVTNGKGPKPATARPVPSSSSALGKPSTSEASPGPSKKAPRRRKANRACSHCQKAHLTCDDARPCERCVKKGLANTCTDGARKKAKYLLEDDELLDLKRDKDGQDSESMDDVANAAPVIDTENQPSGTQQLAVSQAISTWPTSTAGMNDNDMAHSQPKQMYFPSAASMIPSQLEAGSVTSGTDGTPSQNHGDNDPYASFSTFSPASSNSFKHAFGSESASLEYSILSSMLNGIDPSWLSGSPDTQGPDPTTMSRILGPSDTSYMQMGIDTSLPWSTAPPPQTEASDVSPWLNVATPGISGGPSSLAEPLHHLEAPQLSGPAQTDGLAAYDALEVPSPKGMPGVDGVDGKPARISIDGAEQNAQNSKALAAAAAAGLDHKPDALWTERIQHIYADHTRPFPYTGGYHFLIKYATANLDKADVLRIVRALAIFRPSLIALQMPLTEDDEVFVERSIQRTILEFEKLIGFSGTPTVVWRRTCEIVVVGAEFSMLTQWSKDYLRGRYIYEIFEKPSIPEYWEKFAAHAFENTAQSIIMPITLKTSSGSTTRCAACISIKRDMFDLPSLIVGNFLPILG